MRDFFSRISPSKESIRDSRIRQVLGDSILEPWLWSIRRESVCRGFAVGLFWAFIPFPLQMISATVTSLLLRCNVSVSIAACWVTNPVTIPVFFYLNYRVGRLIVAGESMTMDQLTAHFEQFLSLNFEKIPLLVKSIGLPLGVGSLVVATLVSIVSYFVVSGIWRVVAFRKRAKRVRVMNNQTRNL